MVLWEKQRLKKNRLAERYRDLRTRVRAENPLKEGNIGSWGLRWYPPTGEVLPYNFPRLLTSATE